MPAQLAGQHRRGSPAGDAAAHDGDSPDSSIRFHYLISPLARCGGEASLCRPETCQRNAHEVSNFCAETA